PRDQDAAPSFGFDRFPGILGVLVFVEIDDGDISAFARVEYRDGAADSAIATGDNCYLVFKLFRSLVAGRIVHRLRGDVAFTSGLSKMLLGKALGILPRSRLHRSWLLLAVSVPCLGAVDLAL